MSMRIPLFVKLLVFTPLLVSLLLVVSCSSGEDVGELVRIRKELARLEGIDKRLRTGDLSLSDLEGLPGEGLSPAEPEGVRYGLNALYLREFSAWLVQLRDSSLKPPEPGNTAAYRNRYARQQKLRMETYRIFMKRLCFLEGEQLEELYRILASVGPAERAQIYILINDMSLAYYKNVGEINAPTSDEVLTFYSVKVDIGYDSGNKRMQTILNQNRQVMTDIVRNYYSGLRASDMEVGNEFLLKAGLLIRLNRKLLSYDKKGDLFGVQDVAILKLQTFEVP